MLELPAGKLEKGSTPLENGKRELLEETGLEGYSYISSRSGLSVSRIHLGNYPSLCLSGKVTG